MPVRLGISPIGWRNDDLPELGGDIPLAAEWTGRARNCVTLGHGNDEVWWRWFCAALAAVGYDDVLSIEHEDMALPPVEGVAQSVALLRRVMPSA